MVNIVDENILRIVRFKGLVLLDGLQDKEDFLKVIDRFVRFGNVYQLADGINKLVTRPSRIQLFQLARMVVPPQQQMEYSSLIPNYSAPSSVCTSDSGGGGSQGKLRTIRLHRRMGGQQVGPPTFGFSVRGGREHGTGFFVSVVEQGSEAHCQGLRVGDQIVRINGYSVVDAIHREVLRYIKSQNHLELRVRTVGMIPVKDKRTDPLTWRVVDDERLHPPPDLCSPVCNGNSEDIIRDVRLFLNVAPRTKLGCGICKGPEWKPGIFVQFTKENGLAREAGLRPGDQILQCNGVPFIDIPFSDAVNVLKTSSRQLDLIIRKGAGLDLFPGESSGYNSSASSVNGDQSPSWGDAKRLSIVKEESVELEERLGQLDSNHRTSEKHHDWDQIEHGWEKSESNQRKKDSPILRVHFEENGNDHNIDEANRDMSELSLVSSGRNSMAVPDGQQADQKQAGDKLAEIRMVSHQLETKTVVVEVHRSEETDDASVTSPSASRRLEGSDEESKPHGCLAKSPSNSSFVSMGSSSAGSSLSSAISQELQRRSKCRENNGHREPERKKDILKSIDGEKRQQHEQLMDEFKRVHRKMFAHTVAAENQSTTCCHSEGTQLKISHSLEERETKRLQKEEKEEKMSHQRTMVSTKEHSFKDQQGTNEVVREVTIVTKKSTNAPPPPPPMPLSELGTSSPSWKPSSPALSLASSGKTSLNSRPPSCPTPDYDTSSSSSISSPSASLIIVNKNSPSPLTTSPHKSVPGKPQAGHSSPTYASVNKNTKTVLSPQSKLQSPTKSSAVTSQTSPKNSDSVEMQSIESFTLTHPHSTKPKPPDIYFVPVRNKTKPQNSSNVNLSSSVEDKVSKKQRPISITIGEYPSGVERRVPTRFDFLPTHSGDVRKSPTSQTDGSAISNQLHSELAQTLSRSNLRKKTDIQEPLQNGISKDTSSAKGTVTISINCQSPVKNHINSKTSSNYNSRPQVMNGANKIHIESNNNSRSKISIVSTEPKSQVPPRIKPAIRNAADKIAESLGSNNRVTITVPNGVESK